MNNFTDFRSTLTPDDVRKAWVQFAAAALSGVVAAQQNDTWGDDRDNACYQADELTREMIERFDSKDQSG